MIGPRGMPCTALFLCLMAFVIVQSGTLRVPSSGVS
jgi:hypothetical protein